MPDDAKEESLLTYIERLEDTFENRISELEHELKRVEIIANAKAVVVPEGKGIFWTNKISELEKNIENWLKRLSDDQIKIENKIAELKQRIEKLKEQLTTHGHNTYYNGIILNTEVLQDHYKQRIEKSDWTINVDMVV